MKTWMLSLAALILVGSSAGAQGRGTPFCEGFEEGWKTIRGEMAVVPICPIEPVTPVGSTPYREGLKAGMAAGRKSGGRNTGGSFQFTRQGDRQDFCDGFEVGWRSVKGDLAIVPICPLPPITPIGSTPYREGIKAGEAKARQ